MYLLTPGLFHPEQTSSQGTNVFPEPVAEIPGAFLHWLPFGKISDSRNRKKCLSFVYLNLSNKLSVVFLNKKYIRDFPRIRFFWKQATLGEAKITAVCPKILKNKNQGL